MERDAGGGGDCFYFSLYEALAERNLLKNVMDAYGTFTPLNKNSFNQYFRNLIAEQITPARLATTIEILRSTLRENKSKSLYALAELVNLQPWLVQAYKNSNDNTDLFARNVRRFIRQAKNEPQALEIGLARQLLRTAGIALHLVYKNFPERKRTKESIAPGLSLKTPEKKMLLDFENAPTYLLPPSYRSEKRLPFSLPLETVKDEPIVYLVMSRKEGHYYYLTFHDYEGGKRKRSSTKKHKSKRRSKRSSTSKRIRRSTSSTK
jgi:hypothetical protein